MARKKSVKPTSQQWVFASVFVRTASPIKALIEAYPQYSDQPVGKQRGRAKQILSLKGTQVAIKDLQGEARASQRLTVDRHMAELEEIRDLAKKEGKLGVARAAEVDRGKCAGFYVDRSLNMNVVTSTEEIKARLEAIVEQHPQMAALLGLTPSATLPPGQEPKNQVEVVQTVEQAEPLETEPTE